MKKLAYRVLLAIIFLCLYVLFHTSFEELLTKVLVDPFLSKVNINGEPVAVVSYLIVISCLIVWVGQRIVKGFRFSSSWMICSTAFCSLYIYYRFFSKLWDFELLWGNIMALDITLLLPIPFIISIISIRLKYRDHDIQVTKGFLHDEPLTIRKENDPHERHRFMAELKERILQTSKGTSSFCVGVEGIWGAGKTTFLKTLKREIEESKEVIQFDFNPWTRPSNSSLLEAFFNEFSYQLGKHTDLLRGEIEKYAKILVGRKDSSVFSRFVQYLFPSFRWEQSSAETVKAVIETALGNLRRKVVVYIDDIDRLDHNEVTEIFKLVRNSAGFPDVFYIIAFDRSQVEVALKKSFEYNSRTFLEKVLQIEFHLPPPNSDALFASLIKGLDLRISKEESEFLHNHLLADVDFNKPTLLWLKNYFDHPRDIVRFLNQFDFHYTFVKGEVFLPDFLAVMILRFKYPKFTTHLYYQKFEYLTFKDEYHRNLERDGELIMEGVDNKSVDQTQMKLYKALESGIPDAGVEKGDMGPFNILENIFEGPRPYSLPQWAVFRAGPKHHVSIKYSQYFSRYFDFSFSGRLSDVEFDKALYGPKDTFMKKIHEWCQVEQFGRDVLSTISSFSKFVNKDQFEKIISAQIYLANQKDGGNNYYIHPKYFLERLKSNLKNSSMRLLEEYSSIEEICAFILGELDSHNTVGSWSYRILDQLSMADIGEYPIDGKYAALLVIKACEDYFMFPDRITTSYGRYAIDWENACKRTELPSPNLKIRKIILSNLKICMPLFIGHCPRHYNEGRYIIREDWVKAIFENKIQFISELSTTNPEVGKEFLDFEQELEKAKSESRECAKYKFKLLHIDENTDLQ